MSLAFLESVGNLKRAIKTKIGRSISSGVARDATSCLQQGRLFFEAGYEAAYEIRPLLLYYGVLAIAKAVVCAREGVLLRELPARHGLSDQSPEDCGLADLTVQIEGAGVFQHFNDVSNRVHLKYIDTTRMTQQLEFTAAESAQLNKVQLTLKEILARIPALSELYADTFDERSKTQRITLNMDQVDQSRWALRIDDPEIYADRAGLAAMVEKHRLRFPILGGWRLLGATRAWDKSVSSFANFPVPADELSEALLTENRDGGFHSSTSPAYYQALPRTPVTEILTLPVGPDAFHATLVAPVGSVYISQPALHYMGIFLLSTLVRYRPRTWVHAITRTATTDRPADDQALTLVESFMGMPAGAIASVADELLRPSR